MVSRHQDPDTKIQGCFCQIYGKRNDKHLLQKLSKFGSSELLPIPNHWWCWKTPASPLDNKEIKPVNPKRNQPWILIRRTDAEEAPIVWSPDVKSRLIGKDADAGIEGRRRGRQRMRWLDGITHTMDMNLGKLQDGEGHGGPECRSLWGRKDSDTTWWLNNHNKIRFPRFPTPTEEKEKTRKKKNSHQNLTFRKTGGEGKAI